MTRTILVAILILAVFFLGVAAGLQNAPSSEEIVQEALEEMKILNGSALREMMNEAKYSPGAAQEFIHDYPMYAYLFDGSYITYIDN